MKSLKECINENQQVNESFLSIGLTIIVAFILARIGLNFLAGTIGVFNAMKASFKQGKEYALAVKQLDTLLEPYKEELLKTEYASKLYDEKSLITIASMRGKGFAIIYHELDDDIKSVLSADDYKQYLEIIKSIYADEYSRKLNKLKF